MTEKIREGHLLRHRQGQSLYRKALEGDPGGEEGIARLRDRKATSVKKVGRKGR